MNSHFPTTRLDATHADEFSGDYDSIFIGGNATLTIPRESHHQVDLLAYLSRHPGVHKATAVMDALGLSEGELQRAKETLRRMGHAICGCVENGYLVLWLDETEAA